MSIDFHDQFSPSEREDFETRRLKLLQEAARYPLELDFRYELQDTHFIVPASSPKMLRKAVEQGGSGALELLERNGMTLDHVIDQLEIEKSVLEELIENRPAADLILVDNEDATALKEDVIEAARQNAIEIFTEGQWGSSLRFYRPSGLELSFCLGDLEKVLFGVARSEQERYPIDGIIFPKVSHPGEIDWLCDLLGTIEHKIGLKENSISLQFLVESSWSVENLEELCRRAEGRLSAIIFGLADYGSEVSLPDVDNSHPLFDMVRLKMVNIASAFGVAAIDAMTFRYPVADKAVTTLENRFGIVERLCDCYRDALHASHLGMDGKWVGHPLQLLMVKAAFETRFHASLLEEKVHAIESYRIAAENNQGATMIGGMMADRATDRQNRNFLKKAILKGKFSREHGKELGIV